MWSDLVVSGQIESIDEIECAKIDGLHRILK